MMDQSKLEALQTEKVQLAAQATTMMQELTQKSEEIQKYQAEHTMVLSRIWELVGHAGEIVNKAHLYDQLMESADPSSARQTLQILVKYSRSMKDLLKKSKNSCRHVVPPDVCSIRAHPDRQRPPSMRS